jgi:hypothetical protein
VVNKKFDLIIFGYQVWYLTPSIPIISFLKSGFAENILKDTPVVTVSEQKYVDVFSGKTESIFKELKRQIGRKYRFGRPTRQLHQCSYDSSLADYRKKENREFFLPPEFRMKK